MHRSEVVRGFGTTVFIVGVARRGEGGCAYSAQVEVQQNRKKVFRLPDAGKRWFSIVDFSPDGRGLLLSSQLRVDYPNFCYRDVEATMMSLSRGEMHWVNVWDLFGWGDCGATVEAQGFTRDGKVVLRPRPPTWSSHLRPDCVRTPVLSVTDLRLGNVQRLPDDTRVERYGKTTRAPYQTCMTDPDIIGACFVVHGRLSFWNGAPSFRIWRIGTKRILGVRDDIMPESVAAHIGVGVEAYGDFTVCPFTQDRPGAMQMVCIESAESVFYKID